MLHQLPVGFDGEKLKDELVWVGEKVMILKKLSGLPLCPAMKIEHGPVALDQPPTPCDVDSVPGVAVASVNKLFAWQVVG